jgi:hypothetical protein
MWFAQEDLWLQEGILATVAKANQYLSRFKSWGTDPKTQYHVFTNPNWRLSIKLSGESGVVGTLENISRKRLRLDISFLLQVNNPKDPRDVVKLEVAVPGESLAPGEKIRVDQALESDKPPEGIFGVEQVLTISTVPVKRIDQIAIGEKSHRNFPKELKSRGPEAPKEADKEDDKNAPPGKDGGEPRKGGKFPGVNLPGQGKGGEQPGNAGQEALKEKKRYYEVTDQFRRIPVAVVLLVDQDSAHFVQTAFEESKLRFQITQVTLTRFNEASQEGGKGKFGPPDMGGRPPDQPERGPKGGKGMTPSMIPPIMPGVGGAGGRKGGYRPGYTPGGTGQGDRRFFNPGGFIPEGTTGTDEELGDEQGPMMEMVIYGLATLYERYPSKPKEVVEATASPEKK